MIHGMCGSAWCWDNYRWVFESAGYRCITTTLPYHNIDPSDKPDSRLGTTSLLDYAGALQQEIIQLGDKPIIIGHSMGGLLAQLLAERGLAKTLVLLSPSAPAGLMGLSPSLLRSSWSIQSKWGFWKNPMRLSFAEAAYSVLHRLPQNEQRELYAKYVYESGRAGCEIFYWFLDPHHASRVDKKNHLSCIGAEWNTGSRNPRARCASHREKISAGCKLQRVPVHGPLDPGRTRLGRGSRIYS